MSSPRRPKPPRCDAMRALSETKLVRCPRNAMWHQALDVCGDGTDHEGTVLLCQGCMVRLFENGMPCGCQPTTVHAITQPACRHPHGAWIDEACVIPTTAWTVATRPTTPDEDAA